MEFIIVNYQLIEIIFESIENMNELKIFVTKLKIFMN